MATYAVEGPNGEHYEIEGPDDADPSDVVAQLSGPAPAAPAAPQAAPKPAPIGLVQQAKNYLTQGTEGKPLGNPLDAVAEPVVSGIGGLATMVPAGLAGLGVGAYNKVAELTGLPQGPEAGTVVRNIQEKGREVFAPTTQAGQVAENALGAPFDLVSRGTNKAGEVVTDKTGSPALGAAVKTVGDVGAGILGGKVTGKAVGAAKDAIAARLPPEVGPAKPIGLERSPAPNEGIRNARASGYYGLPSEFQANAPTAKIPKAAEKLASDEAPSQLVLRNQALSTKKAAKDAGLPRDTDIQAVDIENARKGPNKAYDDAAAKAGTFKASEAYNKALDELPAESPAIEGKVQRIGDRYRRETWTGQEALTTTRELRDLARRGRNSDNVTSQLQGKAFQKAADALEDEFATALKNRGEGQAFTDFQAAREKLAHLHNVEDALDGGQVSAQKLLQLQKRGAKLSAAQKEIANAADVLPLSTRSSKATAGATAQVKERSGPISEAYHAGLGLFKAAARKTPGLRSKLDVTSPKFQERFGKEGDFAPDRSYKPEPSPAPRDPQAVANERYGAVPFEAPTRIEGQGPLTPGAAVGQSATPGLGDELTFRSQKEPVAGLAPGTDSPVYRQPAPDLQLMPDELPSGIPYRAEGMDMGDVLEADYLQRNYPGRPLNPTYKPGANLSPEQETLLRSLLRGDLGNELFP